MLIGLALCGSGASGCQCLSPTSTCLRQEGPLLTLAQQMRQQHLERSQYMRVIPDPYIPEPVPTPRPSRFHPVPSRNVFHPRQMGQPITGYLPPLIGPDATGDALPNHIPGRSFDSEPIAPGSTAPPTYQPGTSPRTGPEVLPAPLEKATPVVPPELDRSETQEDQVTHNQWIQYPYTLDTEVPISDWVRGVPVRRSNASVDADRTASALPLSQMETRLPRSRALSEPDPVQTVRYEVEGEFAPEVHVQPFIDTDRTPARSDLPESDSAPRRLLKRVTDFGPALPAANWEQSGSLQARQAAVRNGVPYYPTADPGHPYFQKEHPIVQGAPGQGTGSPVQMHTAMQDLYLYQQQQRR